MRFHHQVVRLLVGLTVLSLSVVACHGATSGSPTYLPTSSTENSSGGIAPANKKPPLKIESSCGDRIHIVLLGFVDCKFNEKNYDGNFKVTGQTKGLVSISPSHGSKDTKFTVTGLVVGKGYFLIRGSKGVGLKVKVRVTL
jgi:hypothetical protein